MGLEGGPLMIVKDSLFLLIFNLLGKSFGAVTGPTNDEERFSLFLLISNLLGKGFGAGRGSTNDGEGFSVSTNFKSFRKEVWGREGAH